MDLPQHVRQRRFFEQSAHYLGLPQDALRELIGRAPDASSANADFDLIDCSARDVA